MSEFLKLGLVFGSVVFAFFTAQASEQQDFPEESFVQESVVDTYINNFRSEFKNVIYKLGARGPTYYDCSTSLAYLFLKMGMLKDSNRKDITVSEYRHGKYNPAYIDYDTVNFRVLSSKENLAKGDLILMGRDCNAPAHWVLMFGIDDEKNGHLQENWRVNGMMEVKGDPTGQGKYFDETWHHSKFKDNNLCAAVRHKSFETPLAE